MKTLLSLAVLFSAQAFAASGSFVYTTGAWKGKDVLKNRAHFGYEEICFKGDPNSARKALYAMMSEDYELESVFVRYVLANKSIVYGYVHTKCTDEGMTPDECRSVKIAPACR